MPDTFVFKRYSLAQNAYIDSKNAPLKLKRPPPLSERYPKCAGDPSKPPKDGSAPILSLPTELRLHIYDYLTNDDVVYVDGFKRALNTFDIPSRQKIKFAYLYRSPGRVTRPHAISEQIINLFHICRLMRDELIDACFSDRTFVLEASLYFRSAGGLLILPPNPGPTAWIKRLVILTAVEGNGPLQDIGDLRPLQRMANLKVLYVVFRITKTTRTYGEIDAIERADHVLQAVLECVPKDVEVHFELPGSIKQQLFAQFRDLKHYETSLQDMTEGNKANLKAWLHHLAASKIRKGRLSGSLVNHALCVYPVCLEKLRCINSQYGKKLGSGHLSNRLMLSKVEENNDKCADEALQSTPLAEWAFLQRLMRWTGMGHASDPI